MSEAADPQGQLQPMNPASKLAARQRRAVLVLGMHRSGTSAVAGVVSALGAAAPKTLAGPDRWNERGYFESKLLFTLLDELLAAAGSSWDDWRPFDSCWLRSPAAEVYRRKIAALIADEFGEAPLIVVKDPRLCRLMPLATSILAELGIGAAAILPLRNPIEVAQSLQRRDKLSPAKSLLLWLRHVLDAEFRSRTMPRYWLPYEALLSDWRFQLGRAGEAIGIAWPDRSTRAAAMIEQFLTRDLRHEVAASAEFGHDSSVPPFIGEVYALLTEIAATGENRAALERLDRLRTQFDEACARGVSDDDGEAVARVAQAIGIVAADT